MILDTLQSELKPSFTGDITKGFLQHADKNREHFCEEGRIRIEIISIHTSSMSIVVVIRAHKRLNICFPELCLYSVGPEHQHSKIYESPTGKHIKNYNAGQVSQHPSLLDGNHHMSTFPIFTNYAWIGQGFHSVKETPNHGHSISGVDWEAWHSCGEISHGNSTKRHIKSNQHMETPHAFSNYVKTTLNHGLSLSEGDWGDLKRETTEHGPSLMEVDWGGKIEPYHTSSR